MHKIAKLTGDDLQEFFDEIITAKEHRAYMLEFYVDEGLKVKINGGVWSIGYGTVTERL